MANNRIQVKRTSVSGRTANVTNSGNSQYIAAGELALNMPDGILYTSNGSSLIEVGANNTKQNISTNNLTVGNTLYVVANGNVGIGNTTPAHKMRIQGDISFSGGLHANGGFGTPGQVLTTNSTGVYWSTVMGGGNAASFSLVNDQFTGNGSVNTYTLSVAATTTSAIVAINGVLQEPTEAYSISGTTLTFTENIANGASIDVRIPKLVNDAFLGYSNSLNTSTTAEQIVDAFSTAEFRSATYFAQVTDNTNNNYHVQNITLVHNGSSVFMSEFGAVYSNGSSLATFDASITSNTLSLTVTPVVANSSIKVIRTAVTL